MKNWKLISIFIVCIGLIVVATLFGCENENVKNLKKYISDIERNCPISGGAAGDLISIKYDEDNNQVQTIYTVNKDLISIEALKKNEDLAKNVLKSGYGNNELSEFIKMIVNAGASLQVIYKSSTTPKILKITLPASELKEMLNSPLTDLEKDKMYLENSIAIANSMYPYKIDSGLVIIKLMDEGENIVYTIRCDESKQDMSLLKTTKEMTDKDKKQILKDLTSEHTAKLFDRLNKGIQLRFVGNKLGKIHEITFSSEEIRRYCL